MNKQNIPKKILQWYDNNKRPLPWRKNNTKKQHEYFTLVSEFMLQQTQVKTVIPFFIIRIFARFRISAIVCSLTEVELTSPIINNGIFFSFITSVNLRQFLDRYKDYSLL